MRAKLLGWRELAPAIRHFDFEALDWNGAFVAGQFLSFTGTVDEEPITRAYSIATPPNGRRFGLCANLVQGGRLSPWLFGLEVNDEVEFKGPYGAFILRPGAERAILVATGTGIAPFRSQLMAHLAVEPEWHVTLIFGVRFAENLLYDAEFRALEKKHPNFRYCPTLTQPPAEWSGLTGRVQPHVLAELGDRREREVYICGMREMVDELRTQLKFIGLDRKKIIYEKYD